QHDGEGCSIDRTRCGFHGINSDDDASQARRAEAVIVTDPDTQSIKPMPSTRVIFSGVRSSVRV
ncbi:hypothetical protein, partial [Pandoraea sputorum]|uniref:hypothetical protein n=1 Tax=Pandoraea sputorum TaxID=93222 RepID=UPI003555E423